MLNKIKIFVFGKRKITSFLFFLFLFSFFSGAAFAQDSSSKYEQNIKHDQRPTDLEYALMSKVAYIKRIKKGAVLKEQALSDWKVHDARTGDNDYQGVVFENSNTRQLVVAHRGTSLTSVGNLLEDMRGIVRNKNSPQKKAAFSLTKDMIKYAKENGYHLSFAGHSLGAFLAELSVFYCHSHNYPMVNAITFESPGSQESVEILQSNLGVQKIDLNALDIINYVASPNKINTLNHHLGTMYQLETDLGDRGILNKLNPAWYILNAHTMDKMVDYFYEKTEANYPLAVSDWPVSSLKDFLLQVTRDESILQQSRYFDQECRCYRINIKDGDNNASFDLTYNAHYQLLDYDTRISVPLIHFSQKMQSFLQLFDVSRSRLVKNEDDLHNLIKQFKRVNIPDEIINYLISYSLAKDKAGNFVVHLDSKEADNVYQFRNRLSWYLQDSSNLEAIEDVVAENIRNRCDLDELDNVPYPVTYSQDRKEIKDINALIDRCGNKVCLIYITGFSGSGKTRLAVKYAHDYEQDYHHTRFFDAGSQHELSNSFVSLARSLGHEDLERCLGLPGGKFESCIIDVVKRCLKELPDTSRFLWIFDDAKKAEEIEKYVPGEQGIKGVVLITTKKKGVFANQEIIDLNKGMADGESDGLLRNVVQENIGSLDVDSICSNDEVQKITVDFWHNLPLPISYTGAIIGKLRSCKEYIDMHDAHPKGLDSLAKDLSYKLQSEAIQEHISLLDKLDLEVSGLLVFLKTPFLKDLVIIYITTDDSYREILNLDPIGYEDKLRLYNEGVNTIDKLRISEKIKNFGLIKSDEADQSLSFPHELFEKEMHDFLLKKDEEIPGGYKRLFDRATEFLCQKFTGHFWDKRLWLNEKLSILPSVEKIINGFVMELLESEESKNTSMNSHEVKGTKNLLPFKDSQFILLHRLAKYYIESDPMAAVKLFDKLLDEIAKNRQKEISLWKTPCKKIRSYFLNKEKVKDYTSEYLSNPINQAIIMRDFAAAYCQLHNSGNRGLDLDRAEILVKTAYETFRKELGIENPRTLNAYLILMHIKVNLNKNFIIENNQYNRANMVSFIGSEPIIDSAIALTGLSDESDDFKELRKELSSLDKRSTSYKEYYNFIRAMDAKLQYRKGSISRGADDLKDEL